MKLKIQIKSIAGKLLFEYESENNTIKETVLEAIKSSADLRFADLRSADLRFADLSSANLSSANLRSADLSSANLSSADLRSANLSSANLSSADLRSANLSSANLRSANLSSANLSSADLRFANLSSANLSSANLSSADLRFADLRSANLSSANLSSANLLIFKNDFWNVLFYAKKEIAFLKQSIIDGKIDGSQYEGDCACLVGTIAHAKQCKYDSIIGITPDSSHPSEQWFTMIKKGDKPDNNFASQKALEWLEEFELLINI